MFRIAGKRVQPTPRRARAYVPVYGVLNLGRGRGGGVSSQAVDGTLLINAASKNHIEVVRLLLDKGAEVDKTDKVCVRVCEGGREGGREGESSGTGRVRHNIFTCTPPL